LLLRFARPPAIKRWRLLESGFCDLGEKKEFKLRLTDELEQRWFVRELLERSSVSLGGVVTRLLRPA